jgi:hypothetical protein
LITQGSRLHRSSRLYNHRAQGCKGELSVAAVSCGVQFVTQRPPARISSSQFLSAEFTCYRSAPLQRTVGIAELILWRTVSNAELILQRTVDIAELILRRTVSLAELILRRTVNVAELILRRTVDIAELILRRTVSIAELILRRTVSIAELILRRTVSIAELILRRTVNVAELILQKARFLFAGLIPAKAKTSSQGLQADNKTISPSRIRIQVLIFQTGHTASFYAFSSPADYSCQVYKFLGKSDILCCSHSIFVVNAVDSTAVEAYFYRLWPISRSAPPRTVDKRDPDGPPP